MGIFTEWSIHRVLWLFIHDFQITLKVELEFLIWRGETEELSETSSNQGQEPDTSSTYILAWRRLRETKSRSIVFSVIIPTSLISIIWPNYLGAMFVEMVFKFRWRKEKSPCAHECSRSP